MLRFSLIVFFSFLLAAVVNALPYNKTANASADIQQALSLATSQKKNVLVIFGANWCSDCRALDSALKSTDNAALISSEFVVVKVDVGNFDRNLAISDQYGNPIKGGIPAVVILSPTNQILYSTRAGELANARRMSKNGIYEFFKNAAASGSKKYHD
ncbi:MAG: thioredoxin family protein [Gammaproteobacteria bacterium]|nr:MAG: thioredoxin family protein [Gammaproteobacteria bacterium]